MPHAFLLNDMVLFSRSEFRLVTPFPFIILPLTTHQLWIFSASSAADSSSARVRHTADGKLTCQLPEGSCFRCSLPSKPYFKTAGARGTRHSKRQATASHDRRNSVKGSVPSGEIFLCPRPAYRRRPARLPGARGTWLSELPAKKTIPRDARASRKESGPSHV